MMSTMRSDRLLSILLLLQAHGRLSARELAARLETSVRTIHRDIDALGAAGVPVFTERGRRGGTAILPGYRTDVTGLTPAEAEAIFVAAGQGALADLGLEEELRLGLRKLMAALPESQRPSTQRARDRVIVESGRWLNTPEPTPWLETVRTAVLEDRQLEMTYRRPDADGARATLVDPLGLVAKAGVWYLIATPVLRTPLSPDEPPPEARLYRVSRIETAVVTDDATHRPTKLDVAGEWRRLRRRVEERGPGVAVRIAVEPHRVEMVKRMVRAQLVEAPGDDATGRDAADPSGRAVLELRFVALGAAEGVLLGFGTDVEVLAPPELRESMAETAAKVAALYR
jgi:predicted DNA-binding transcriptional regulator YafY